MAPWSSFWEHNRFAQARPALQVVLDSPYARGAVTGVGALTAAAGLAELGSVIFSKGRRRRTGSEPPSPAVHP